LNQTGGWTSLEIAKLVVAALTPLVVAVLGAFFARTLKHAENEQWFGQRLVEKRIELLDEALPTLNELYCYFMWFGIWKELSPMEVLERKRRLDRLFYTYRPFFSRDAVAAYEGFQRALFSTYPEPEKSALLRTTMKSRHGDRAAVYPGVWQPAWSDMFSTGEHEDWDDIRELYDDLTACLASEVGAR
jgi:hypothetical protein